MKDNIEAGQDDILSIIYSIKGLLILANYSQTAQELEYHLALISICLERIESRIKNIAIVHYN